MARQQPGVDQVAVATNGVGRVFVDANGDVSLPRASGGYMFQTGGSIRAGIRSNDNNELLFNRGTDSTEMVLTATGVGIGTTSPASALHVVTSGAGEIRHADGARTVSMGSTGTISYIGSVTPGNGLALYSANEEKARIDASGRLLVGASSAIQTSSNSLIQVASSTGGYYIAARSDTSVSTDNVIGGMRFYGNDSDGNYDECARIECAADGGHGDDNKQSRLAFFTTASGASSPTERMRITSAGRVGIGTASPQATLHLESSAGAQLRIKSGVGNAQIDLIAAGQTTPFYIYCNSSRNLVFQDNSAERARIDSSGRLLVGTASAVGGGSSGELLQVGFSGGSRAILANTSTSLASGALLGLIDFTTNVGSSISTGASIKANCDGTAAVGDAPTRLTFWTTADGASTPTERVRIESGGKTKFSGGAYGIERTATAAAFNLHTGNFWTCGAIAIPNPTNQVAGMMGSLRVTAAPTSFAANWKHPGGTYTAPTTFPAVAPFYVQASGTILLGSWTEGIA
jgi:hypothetical protein